MQNSTPTENLKDNGTNSSANKKGILLIVVLLVIVATLLVTCIKMTNQPQSATTAPSVIQQTTQAPVQQSSVQQTTAQVTTEPAAEQTTAPQADNTTAKTEPETTAAPKDEKQEILDAVAKGINSLKDPSASFKGTKTQVLSITLVDCSMPKATGIVNKVLDFFAGEEVFEFDFTDGTATDPETGDPITSAKAIPPTDKPFTLTKEGIAEAKKEIQGDNTVYTIKLVPESSTLEDPRPPHHGGACDTLDFSAFSLPLGEVTKADFTYPGATVSVTLDKSGKIVRYHERLDMSGVGEGRALGLTASGTIDGYIDETWDIVWK